MDYLKAKRTSHVQGILRIVEISIAEIILLKRAQRDIFHDEHKRMKEDKEISRNSALKTLSPFLSKNLILVGGRLVHADLTEAQRHPIVVPYHHTITKLIFKHLSSPQLLLSEVRRIYWPIKVRLIARSTVVHCVHCLIITFVLL